MTPPKQISNWQKVFRTFYDDNVEGGSSRWRVNPDVTKAFVQEEIAKARKETLKEVKEIIESCDYSQIGIATMVNELKSLK